MSVPLRFVLLGLLLVAPSALSTGSLAASLTENQIRAGFLYNFTLFVSWPSASFPEPSSPFIVGVLGSDPFGDELEQLLAGKETQGRKVQVLRYSDPAAAHRCHIVLVSPSYARNYSHILAQLRGAAILTVGEGVDFARAGGMIGFYRQDNRVKLAINRAAASRAGLGMSSQLLGISQLVNE